MLWSYILASSGPESAVDAGWSISELEQARQIFCLHRLVTDARHGGSAEEKDIPDTHDLKRSATTLRYIGVGPSNIVLVDTTLARWCASGRPLRCQKIVHFPLHKESETRAL